MGRYDYDERHLSLLRSRSVPLPFAMKLASVFVGIVIGSTVGYVWRYGLVMPTWLADLLMRLNS